MVEVKIDTILLCIYVQQSCMEEYFDEMLVCMISVPQILTGKLFTLQALVLQNFLTIFLKKPHSTSNRAYSYYGSCIFNFPKGVSDI